MVTPRSFDRRPMAAGKRAYKLQEFVAHASSVNCLKIGRKTSRVLATGGEDHKVNLWSIGKPNAILSLSGHTSAVESVSFDSSEVHLAGGAANGTIKLWDLEEAKIMRSFTGHRSNCLSMDFHPFGEFLASGSLDTNLKIWDMRKKRCIHTYKGHTRGINAVQFTPDGRWVVSGGEDNVVKLWDLTAGKILHEFKNHGGQIQCIDFHPSEFLLATGSADRTVRFWDLETFEPIGSTGPEVSGVRSLTFHPDGRTLLCGLHENLKVVSWEPIRCHDTIDAGWCRLSDLNVHDGKLLGCSYNQSCVGVWVVDISKVEPYAVSTTKKFSEGKFPSSGKTLGRDDDIKTSLRRLSFSHNLDTEAKKTLRTEENKTISNGSLPATPRKAVVSAEREMETRTKLKRSSSNSETASNIQIFCKPDGIHIAFAKSSPRMELEVNAMKETSNRRTSASQSKMTKIKGGDDSERENIPFHSGVLLSRSSELSEVVDQNFISEASRVKPSTGSLGSTVNIRHAERRNFGSNLLMEPMPSLQRNYNNRKQKAMEVDLVETFNRATSLSQLPSEDVVRRSPNYGRLSPNIKGRPSSAEKEVPTTCDEDIVADLLEGRSQFLSSVLSRLSKLQVLLRLWERNNVKAIVSSIRKMSDHDVAADIISVLTGKDNVITLDICADLLPLLNALLEDKMDRHVSISLDMFLKLVREFGTVIRSTLTASLVGVDLEAEKRIERCNLCFIELQRTKNSTLSLIRRGGSISKSACQLALALQEIL